MEERDGYRKFLEIQVEALQEQLFALERDPDQVEHLKAMLRTVQRLRHAQEPGEPDSVRLLRNAVEKVTLHVGRARLVVTQEFLDFYVDSFELLEEAVRRWPGGPSFDRARYADRVRSLLETTAASGAAAAPRRAIPEEPVLAPRMPEPAWEQPAHFAAMAEEPVSAEVADEIVLTGPEPSAEPDAVEAAQADTPAAVEVLPRSSLDAAELESYVEADLQDLLAEPWETGTAPRPEERRGGLAASYATYEAMRTGGDRRTGLADRGAESGVRESLDRLRDVLDTFSVSLNDLDRAAERLLRGGGRGLDRTTQAALADRLQAEKEKVLVVFDRTIETFRRAEV